MPDPSPHKTPPAEAIAAYRAALLRHAPADELARLRGALDPETAAWLDLFQASRQEAIRPDPTFVRRLDRIVAAAPGPTPTGSMIGQLAPVGVLRSHAVNGKGEHMNTNAAIPASLRLPWHTAWRQSTARLATAVLLIALFVGSAWTALYPLGLWNNEGLPLLAPPATEVAAPDIATTARLEHLWESEGGSGDSGAFDRPYGMGVDAEGNLWVIDAGNDRIQIIAPDGAHLETWGSSGSGDGQFEFLSRKSQFGLPYGDVDFDADGNIYVIDTGNARVQKFGPDRAFIRAWGEEGQGDGQFVVPISVAVGPNGVIYVSDEQRDDIQMFDRDGNFLGAFGGPGSAPGQLSLASGLAFDGAGNLWVADWMNNRVQRFTADGESLAVWGEQGLDEGELNGPSDIVVDDQGHVFVADDMNNRLQAFTADGTFLASFGGFRSDVGTFANPIGLAVSEDGVVYVSDRRQVQAFRLITNANPLSP
jgi:DNA-binding beta-propeller fold protein YncE